MGRSMEQKTEICRVENLYDLNETIARDLFDGVTYPWEVLPHISDFIRRLGPTLDPEIYEQRGEDIWIAKSADIAPTAYINGPVIICPNATVRHCAFIRSSAIVGEGATVGNSTELKNVILFNRVEVPHYNYVGDSVLGFRAHLGAGAITSNIKADRKNLVVREGDLVHETGLRKFGAMLGDHVEVGCNSVLNPGSVVGPWTNIYPLSMVRGVIPGHSIYKNKNEIVIKREDASES